MRVLVTSSRMPFALDEIRKLGKAGLAVVASDTFESAPGSHSRYVEESLVTPAPRREPEAFLRAVAEIVETRSVDLILPAFEEVFYLASDRGRLGAELFAGEGELRSDDDLPGRRFVLWEPEELRDLLAGAGFAVDRLEVTDRGDDLPRLLVEATRLRTLPDTVGPDMRLLVCGLNPSLVAADAGVGFAGPTNRFWKALRLAGLSEVDRDARLLLHRDGIGMTDQVKRATRAASELRAADYRSGVARLERLVARTQPAALCVVGLAGWRAAVDRSARPGWQLDTGWAAPVYVMPSTSGLNAGTSLDELATHLAAAERGR